jgi:hypothetical protein
VCHLHPAISSLQLTLSHSAPIIIYGYLPSFPLAVFAATLFGVSLLAHIYQIYHYRTWYFVTVPIALVLEVLGYIFRSLSAHVDPYRYSFFFLFQNTMHPPSSACTNPSTHSPSVIYFVLQYFFIVTSPVFLSAAIYAILSILIRRIGPTYSPLPPSLVLWIFISSDVITTIIQILGAALIGSAESKQKDPTLGKNILLAGLAIQVFDFLIFLTMLSIFFTKARKVVWERKEGRVFLVAFVTATLFVYLRTCFRLAEVAQGVQKYLFTHEDYFAGLEFAPIAGAMVLFNFWHPGRCLKKEVVVQEE